jgi:hypothetical protein
MNNAVNINEAQTDWGKYLLDAEDFMEIETGDGKYLFLSETLQYFKITEPPVDEYLRLCKTGDTENTYLGGEEIRNF